MAVRYRRMSRVSTRAPPVPTSASRTAVAARVPDVSGSSARPVKDRPDPTATLRAVMREPPGTVVFRGDYHIGP